MATTEHYGITEINGTEDISNIPINQAFEKIDTEMWKIPQYRANLSSSDDLNNLSGSGLWWIQGTIPSNAPSGVTWSMLFQYVVGTVKHQYLFKPVSCSLYVREYTGSPASWCAWQEIQEHTRSVVNATRQGSIWTSGDITAIKKNGIVTVKFANVAHTQVASRTTIATLPTGFRPAVEASFCADRDTSKWFFVTPGGEIRIDPCSAGSAYGGVTYVTA